MVGLCWGYFFGRFLHNQILVPKLSSQSFTPPACLRVKILEDRINMWGVTLGNRWCQCEIYFGWPTNPSLLGGGWALKTKEWKNNHFRFSAWPLHYAAVWDLPVRKTAKGSLGLKGHFPLPDSSEPDSTNSGSCRGKWRGGGTTHTKWWNDEMELASSHMVREELMDYYGITANRCPQLIFESLISWRSTACSWVNGPQWKAEHLFHTTLHEILYAASNPLFYLLRVHLRQTWKETCVVILNFSVLILKSVEQKYTQTQKWLKTFCNCWLVGKCNFFTVTFVTEDWQMPRPDVWWEWKNA